MRSSSTPRNQMRRVRRTPELLSAPSGDAPVRVLQTESRGPAEADLPLRRGRGYAQAAAVLVLTFLVFFWAQSVATNKRMEWNTVADYLFNDRIIAGAGVTMTITAIAMTIGLILSIAIAIMRLARNKLLSAIAAGYVWIFRAIPLLVLLIIAFNLALLYPSVSVGVPYGATVLSVPTRDLITPMGAAILAFALNEAAYSSEVLRSAILAVPSGQREAAKALGMPPWRIYWRVVLPQAVRIAVPPLFNNCINMVKGTSLVAFISVFDLTYTAQSIYQLNYQVMPLLFVVSIWYLAIVTALTALQSLIEWKFAKTSRRRRGAVGVDHHA